LSHLQLVHDAAGHVGQPAGHLVDALPHALLHLVHVGSVQSGRVTGAAAGTFVPAEVLGRADSTGVGEPAGVRVSAFVAHLVVEKHVRADGFGRAELLQGVLVGRRRRGLAASAAKWIIDVLSA